MIKKIAITGVNGFVGGVLARDLAIENYKIVGCGKIPSLINQQTAMEFCEGHFQNEAIQGKLLHETNVLIHCAASVYLHYGKNETIEQINDRDALLLVEKAIDHGVKHILFFSSIHAFKEDLIDINKNSPFEDNENAAYNFSKGNASRAIKKLCQEKGIKCSILYPTAILGTHNERGGTMQKVLDLAIKWPVLFLPKASFDIVDIDDVAEACSNIIKHEIEGDFILASGKNIQIIALARQFLKLQNKKKIIIPLPMGILLPLSKLIYIFNKKTDFSPYNMYTLYYGSRYKINSDLDFLVKRSPNQISCILKKIIKWKQL